MELLPIIYSSLLIFAGLMISAILFSYVAHRIKKAKNPEKIEDEQPVYLKPPTLTRERTQTPAVATRPSSKEKSEPVKKEKAKSAPKPKSGVKSKPEKEKKKSPKRYKVITHISKPAEAAPVIRKKKKENEKKSSELRSLGDNVIDKYADEDEKLYSLKTEKGKKEKK